MKHLHLVSGILPDTLRNRLFGGVHRTVADAQWTTVAGDDWSDRIMSLRVTDRLHEKQGRSIARWVTDAAPGGLVVYLKRHYRLPRWRGIMAVLFPWHPWSPGLQEYQNLQMASHLGVPVPRTLAAADLHGPWGRLQSMIAIEELHDMLPLHEAIPQAGGILNPDSFVKWKQGLIREMARLTRLLHDQHYFHKDLYLCHFYIRQQDIGHPPEDWTGRIVMIDFHRFCRHRILSRWYRVKDLAQLAYSSEVQGVEPADREYFRECYGTLSGLEKKAIRIRWNRYRDHNRKKRRHASA